MAPACPIALRAAVTLWAGRLSSTTVSGQRATGSSATANARRESRHEQAFDPGGEGHTVHGAVNHHRHAQPIEAQSGDERRGLPVAVRHWRPAALCGHAGAPSWSWRRSPLSLGPMAFQWLTIDEDEPRRIEIGLELEPGPALGLHMARSCSLACVAFS